jgi:glycosyltransferase involved in cell wall biosynthesis
MHAADDKRVHYKEALALNQAGFQISHVVRDGNEGEMLDGIRLLSFPARGRGIFDRLRCFWRIYRLARSAKAEVYHCNEADSWIIGIVLKLFSGAKLVHDVHEIYSSDLAESRFPAFLRPLIVALARVLFIPLGFLTDRFVFAKASVAIDYPLVSKRKCLVAANYVELPKDLLSPAEHPEDSVKPVTILHLGAINQQRGWPELLKALSLARNERLRLRVVGRFGDGSEAMFLKTADQLGLSRRVEFVGQVLYSQVQAEVKRAHIGVIAFQPVMLNFTHALPHKLFDYMLGGLPVVVPNFSIEVEEIVRTAKCGLPVSSECPLELAAAFDQLADNASLRRQMGARGREAILTRYNWNAEAEKLIAFYDELAGVASLDKKSS